MVNKVNNAVKCQNAMLMKCYDDDSTVLEVISRNYISMLDIAVRDILEYCISHRMKGNTKI